MFTLEKTARSMFQAELGLYLKEQRISAGLTQDEIASKLGLRTPQFISNIERGKCAVPMHLIRRLIQEYHIDKREFLDLISVMQMTYFKKSLLGIKKTGRVS